MKKPTCPKCGSTKVYHFSTFSRVNLKHGTIQETFRCQNIKCNPSGSENFHLHYNVTPMSKNSAYCERCGRIGPIGTLCLCNGEYKNEYISTFGQGISMSLKATEKNYGHLIKEETP